MSLMISALVRKGRCHLTQLAQAAPSNAKTESTHRRFQRFIASDAEPKTLILPFIQPLLRAFEGIRLPLALDVSEIGRGCVVLMLGILYKGRLLPLLWQVEQGGKGHWSADKHVAFAKHAKELMASRQDVVLLGDGEYDNVSFCAICRKNVVGTSLCVPPKTRCSTKMTTCSKSNTLCPSPKVKRSLFAMPKSPHRLSAHFMPSLIGSPKKNSLGICCPPCQMYTSH